MGVRKISLYVKRKILHFTDFWSDIKNIEDILLKPERTNVLAWMVILAELILNVFIINTVSYTEIDWNAYMQEVEGFLKGDFNYTNLKGDTGPLVYPAGFVYIFAAFYYLTGHGQNIQMAQYIFMAIYIINLALVFRVYAKAKKVPPYMLLFMSVTSYRVHSIFVLRLFNDPMAVCLFFVSLNLFLDNRWSLGSLFYSLAVSVKMNILLFAPALLLAYLATQGILGTVRQLSICALVQIVLALPFLLTDPVSYIKNSFNFGRVFYHKWTVNWRFIPEETFVDKYFHIGLLVLHLCVLLLFVKYWWRCLTSYAKLRKTGISVSSQLLILPLFCANFIGMAFSRSLHYQFYVWYFYTLPYLVWTTPFSAKIKSLERCRECYAPSRHWPDFTMPLGSAYPVEGKLPLNQIGLKR
ncbi:lethal(2)neighbour of tid protein 2-like isoform X2 [Artemia franciscana]|uniref:lethal(2)neighbour of tid protein 2-like isoform X2 n=1 Tax=Artemia franciscana TaxID=6661 RepID=UPI0032DA0205